MSENERTRTKIIEAATRLFSCNGYYNTKVSDIVKEAAVAQGTFYLYFKTKEEVFHFLVMDYLGKLEDVVQKNIQVKDSVASQSAPPAKDVFNYYYNLFHDLLMIYFENKSIWWITVRDGMNFSKLTAIHTSFKERLAHLLICHYPDEKMAYASIGMVAELTFTWFYIRKKGVESVPELARTLAEIHIKLLES
ncbi:TetR/AcrR family transcriptional regulator [Paenibacillus filicis]|uniref:TetR/AcrR family transcriptional regulator n=1 Tax=Paenibacillus gyeongsangnamensis TaxID=3388067 RepID=A0ABT4Q8E5_9BACL|nr:TetR/AcrR family transcriptional regulator [Paenibacillus filicis]MCZ8513140.1 TetR/AcrR family transcriptional regulator [Paenibacillus filicis]